MIWQPWVWNSFQKVNIGPAVVALVGLAALFYSLFLLGWQLLFWLRDGVWVSLSILDLLVPPFTRDGPQSVTPDLSHIFPGLSSWMSYPQDWIGVHKVLRVIFDLLPFHLITGCVGSCVLVWGAQLSAGNAAAPREHDPNASGGNIS